MSIIDRLNIKEKFVFFITTYILVTGVTIFSLNSYFFSPKASILGSSDSIDKTNNTSIYLDSARNTAIKSNDLIAESIDKLLFDDKKYILDVPLISQIYKLSCEAATLQMILEYRGISKNQDELMLDIGTALPIVPQNSENLVVWGDPDIGFVGDHKGKYVVARDGKLVGDGWGANEGPVLNAVLKYRAGSWAKKNATINDLKLALQSDMPVVFWHVRPNHDKEKMEYLSPNGERVLFTQFHVKALIGFQIDENGNEKWVSNDPIYGRIEQTTEQLMQEWGEYNNRMVAVA